MGYVNVDTIYEEEGKEKVEVKNDYVSVEEMSVVEMVMKKSRFIAMAFHVESDDDVIETINELRSCGCTVGLSIKPGTAADAVFPYLELIDLVLVMTVEPGFGGQSFMADMMDKLSAVKREINKRKLAVKVQTDGGIDENTVAKVASHGSNVVVAGTAVFRHASGMKYAVEKLHSASDLLDSALKLGV